MSEDGKKSPKSHKSNKSHKSRKSRKSQKPVSEATFTICHLPGIEDAEIKVVSESELDEHYSHVVLMRNMNFVLFIGEGNTCDPALPQQE